MPYSHMQLSHCLTEENHGGSKHSPLPGLMRQGKNSVRPT